MMEKALRGSFGAVFMAGAQYDDPRVAQGDVWQEEGGLGTWGAESGGFSWLFYAFLSVRHAEKRL